MGLDEYNALDTSKLNCLFQRFHKMKNKFTSKLGKTKHYRLFEKGRDKLGQEIDVVNLIRSRRHWQKVIQLVVKILGSEENGLREKADNILTLVSDSDSNDSDG